MTCLCHAEALEQSQKLGEEGDVDGSMVFAQQVESLTQQHDSLKKTLTQPERTMTVCEVCGVFINSTDNEQRRKASSVSCLLAFPAKLLYRFHMDMRI